MGLGSWFQNTLSRPIRRVGGLPVESDLPDKPQSLTPQDFTQQAYANNPNIRTPYGNVISQIDKRTGQITQTVSPSKQQQQAYRQLFNMEGLSPQRVSPQGLPGTRSLVPTTAGFTAAPNVQGVSPNITGQFSSQAGPIGSFVPQSPDVSATRNAVFEQARALLEPQFNRAIDRTEQNAANAGLPVGSEAYNEMFRPIREQQNQALTQAALQAVLAGNQEQGRLFNQELQGYGANLGAQGQQFGQDIATAQQNQGVNAQNFGQMLAAVESLFGRGLQAGQFEQGQNAAAADRAFQQNLLSNEQNFNQGLQRSQVGFGQDLAAAGQNFNQELQAREAQRLLLAQLLGLAPGVQNNAPVNILGGLQSNQASQAALYNNALSGQQEALSGLWGGLGSLGGAAIKNPQGAQQVAGWFGL